MLTKLFALVAGFIIATISTLGYGGIVALMAVESACIPLPSELIMPFAGYLAFRGQYSLALVALAGTVGCVLGSLVAYFLGVWGGRPLVEKYGRYILVSRRDLARVDRWFARRGDFIILVGRVLPGIRTFIALPAGVAHMGLARFIIYTFIGSSIWCWLLAWVGFRLGQHWDTLGPWFHRFDAVIAGLLILGFLAHLWRHLRASRPMPPDAG